MSIPISQFIPPPQKGILPWSRGSFYRRARASTENLAQPFSPFELQKGWLSRSLGPPTQGSPLQTQEPFFLDRVLSSQRPRGC